MHKKENKEYKINIGIDNIKLTIFYDINYKFKGIKFY